MSNFQTLTALVQWLAGEFDNRKQAFEQPAWFVHLRLWQRPLRQRIQGKLALFAEQANALYLNQPYRQRVVVFSENGDRLQAQYLALKHPNQFQGAGADTDLLNKLEASDLEPLLGCVLDITLQDNMFKARPLPESKCCFEYEGTTRQVVLGFDVGLNSFASYDRGVDPETGQALWGALMGPYEFSKCEDFAAELPE
ncbi:chromophore lyase CpcT/CpeT [Oculatella sp. FACHB-28]|uniref:chromophore lyase CpcT/CpeT n=1 Tax=Oculatella sp. FACHB-28 TaxID=2692845 RepID=UPI0016825A38|nr:chromophore lyase CpcT/CpeT [Oculatella sp. FACHB-28]MBD2057144.1 chromophore lyase CpcT/CpeT [Oculatella sp. FACHB-28]